MLCPRTSMRFISRPNTRAHRLRLPRNDDLRRRMIQKHVERIVDRGETFSVVIAPCSGSCLPPF